MRLPSSRGSAAWTISCADPKIRSSNILEQITTTSIIKGVNQRSMSAEKADYFWPGNKKFRPQPPKWQQQ
jgi:hypothetical protein